MENPIYSFMSVRLPCVFATDEIVTVGTWRNKLCLHPSSNVALMALLNVPFHRMFFEQQENNLLLGSHVLRAVR